MQIRLPASYLRCMTIEPTIMHAAGAGIERTHDAAVIFLDHQGARIRFLDGAELSAVSAAHLDLTELHDTFRVHDKSFTGGFGRSHPDDTPMFAALAQVVLRTYLACVLQKQYCRFMAFPYPVNIYEEKTLYILLCKCLEAFRWQLLQLVRLARRMRRCM